METIVAATLTGSDTPVEGLARQIILPGYTDVYDFLSTDETLHLVIGRTANGDWERLDGTDPYFSGWVDELAEQITAAKLN
jgi:hypothetical protein